MSDPAALAPVAARAIAAATGVVAHDVAVVAGSGWADAVAGIGRVVASVPAAEIPGFSASAVAGHADTIRSIEGPTGARILVLGARRHFYQGRDAAAVAHGVRVAAAAGCSSLVVTNAAGSIRAEWSPGTVVAISDHINLTGASPLDGPRFVDLTDAYSPRLRAIAREVDPRLPEGVYAQFPGPQYETPAEIRAARVLGADLVGMSTALEVIAARAEGLEVLGLSLVTNPAAGTGGTLSHDEVLAAGTAAGPSLAALLGDIVARI